MNTGAKWCLEQEAWLLLCIAKGKELQWMADKMERTKASIQARLTLMAANMVLDATMKNTLLLVNPDVAFQQAVSDASVKTGILNDFILLKLKTLENKKKTYYAVRVGMKPGIYLSWEECLEQIQNVSNNQYKKFSREEDAIEYMNALTIVDINKNKTAINGVNGFVETDERALDPATLMDMTETANGANESLEWLSLNQKFEKPLFITGAAGTGKSYTIQRIAAWAQKHNKNIAITATTGAAAQLIDGRTINSFLGIGLGTKELTEMVSYAKYRLKPVVSRIRELDILVIDEISTMSAELFDYIVEYIVSLKQNSGQRKLRLILSGDFKQLPPVKGNWIHLAKYWTLLAPHVMRLTKQMRQLEDPLFQEMLNRFREGIVTDEDYMCLKSLKHTEFANGIKPTTLLPINSLVDAVNKSEYDALVKAGAKIASYGIEYGGDKGRSKAYAASLQIPEQFELCVGAQVIVTRNLPLLDLVNGSRGIILALSPRDVTIRTQQTTVTFGKQQFASIDDERLRLTFLPVKLAFAISIHKSQGMTLDAIEIDIGKNIFQPGQAYVALSRAKSLKSIRILDIDRQSLTMSL